MLTLFGRIPSKKNGKIMICRGTRPILVSTPKFAAWHEEQMWRLKDQKLRKEVPGTISEIEVTIYAPDKRKADLSNKIESIMDLLVDSQLIEDDNWYICPKLILIFGGVDVENPRAELKFKPRSAE